MSEESYKSKRIVDWDYVIKQIITWLAIAAILLAVTSALYGCSVAFIKGSNNTATQADEVDASGEQLDVLDRRRGDDKTPFTKKEKNKKDTATIDTVSVKNDTINKH